ncbi:MAG: glycine zipper 2TM domain-containing protein [Proteobacteria bacterium]|nr:glycine zipper 2TM domain-containing protein [Pseudomonadota bacterium]
MKLRLIVSFALILFFSSEVFASNVKVDYATVIDAEPILKTIRVSTPRQECWEEEIADYYRYDDHPYASNGHRGVSTLVGGVVGGAIGNAVGHRKRNRQVGAVVGAVLGAVIGNACGRAIKITTGEVAQRNEITSGRRRWWRVHVNNRN